MIHKKIQCGTGVWHDFMVRESIEAYRRMPASKRRGEKAACLEAASKFALAHGATVRETELGYSVFIR